MAACKLVPLDVDRLYQELRQDVHCRRLGQCASQSQQQQGQDKSMPSLWASRAAGQHMTAEEHVKLLAGLLDDRAAHLQAAGVELDNAKGEASLSTSAMLQLQAETRLLGQTLGAKEQEAAAAQATAAQLRRENEALRRQLALAHEVSSAERARFERMVDALHEELRAEGRATAAAQLEDSLIAGEKAAAMSRRVSELEQECSAAKLRAAHLAAQLSSTDSLLRKANRRHQRVSSKYRKLAAMLMTVLTAPPPPPPPQPKPVVPVPATPAAAKVAAPRQTPWKPAPALTPARTLRLSNTSLAAKTLPVVAKGGSAAADHAATATTASGASSTASAPAAAVAELRGLLHAVLKETVATLQVAQQPAAESRDDAPLGERMAAAAAAAAPATAVRGSRSSAGGAKCSVEAPCSTCARELQRLQSELAAAVELRQAKASEAEALSSMLADARQQLAACTEALRAQQQVMAALRSCAPTLPVAGDANAAGGASTPTASKNNRQQRAAAGASLQQQQRPGFGGAEPVLAASAREMLAEVRSGTETGDALLMRLQHLLDAAVSSLVDAQRALSKTLKTACASGGGAPAAGSGSSSGGGGSTAAAVADGVRSALQAVGLVVEQVAAGQGVVGALTAVLPSIRAAAQQQAEHKHQLRAASQAQSELLSMAGRPRQQAAAVSAGFDAEADADAQMMPTPELARHMVARALDRAAKKVAPPSL